MAIKLKGLLYFCPVIGGRFPEAIPKSLTEVGHVLESGIEDDISDVLVLGASKQGRRIIEPLLKDPAPGRFVEVFPEIPLERRQASVAKA